VKEKVTDDSKCFGPKYGKGRISVTGNGKYCGRNRFGDRR
jgi:hypothetical protein